MSAVENERIEGNAACSEANARSALCSAPGRRATVALRLGAWAANEAKKALKLGTHSLSCCWYTN